MHIYQDHCFLANPIGLNSLEVGIDESGTHLSIGVRSSSLAFETPASSITMTGNQKTSLTEGNPYIAANGHDPESLAVEGGSRTAFYNHASEKSLSHAEAKMIYRRHVLESAEQDESRPLKRVQTYSSIEKGNPNLGISCT